MTREQMVFYVSLATAAGIIVSLWLGNMGVI